MGQEWLLRKELKDARRAKNHAEHVEKMRAKTNGKRAVRSLQSYSKALDKELPTMDVPDPRLLPDQELVDLVAALMNVDKYDWLATARPEQIEPADYAIWLNLCGRGWGKTRAAAEAVRKAVETPNTRAAVIAKDHRALRDVCFEGVSGLLAVIPPDQFNFKDYNKGLGDVQLKLKNGSSIKGYTGGEPDAIRGQSFDILWGDEFASWPAARADDMLTQARMCLREADHARAILTTTPKRVPHVINMVNLAKDPAEKIVVTTGTSRDNTALSDSWHEQMERTYGNTRMGRQELLGELVMDNERALWTSEMVEGAMWLPYDAVGEPREMPQLVGVFTGVDPSGSKDGDAMGIVTVGWDRNKCIYVLDNATTNGTPDERYSAACLSAMKWGASQIWYESAYGGDQSAYGLAQQWKNLQERDMISKDHRCPLIYPSKVKGDKAARAMPCVALFEQQIALPERHRIWMAQPNADNKIAGLVEEFLVWETDSTKSPNAIDAFVHATRAVMRATGQEVVISAPISPHSTRRNNTLRVGGGYRPYG